MNRNKASGPALLTSYTLENLGDCGVRTLIEIFQDVAVEVKFPHDWKSSRIVPVYKGKCDVLN